MQLTPAQIYRTVFAGNIVEVRCSKAQFPALRVAVAKRHSTTLGLEMTTQRLSALYNESTGVATFRLLNRMPPRSFEATVIEL